MGHVVEYWSTHDFKMSDFAIESSKNTKIK